MNHDDDFFINRSTLIREVLLPGDKIKPKRRRNDSRAELPDLYDP